MFSLIRSGIRKPKIVYGFLLLAMGTLVLSSLTTTTRAAFVQPAVSSSDIQTNEGTGVANFTFNLSYASQSDVRVNYSTVSGGSATAGSDYLSVTRSSFTIPAGATSATVTIKVIDDTTPEQPETFFVGGLAVTSENATVAQPGQWMATIIDNDTPIAAPPPPMVTPPPTIKPTPPPTITPPTPTPAPVVPPPTVVITSPDPAPPSPGGLPSVQVNIPTHFDQPDRSAFVKSVLAPNQLRLTKAILIKSSLLALLLILLILFPAELFNATLQSNYNEVSGWFKFKRLRRWLKPLSRLPQGLALFGFATAGAVLNSQLSPGFRLNQGSLALLVGIFITLVITAVIYDLARLFYLKRRFGLSAKLRTHVIGLLIGAVMVAVSRAAHFLPGYFYGLFTALVFQGKDPSDEQDGEGLAIATIGLLVLAMAGWFAWVPVRAAATHSGASFAVLVLDATLSSLWVTALIAIVFGLAPIRFFYGEQVKKWNKTAWWIIYISGVVLFSYAVLQGNVYSTTDKTSLPSVLVLFIGFGLFSLIFWAYFRYRHLWRHTPELPYEEH